MTLEIIGKITGAKSDNNELNIAISEHRGLFSPRGRVGIHFDKQAMMDLASHFKSKSAGLAYNDYLNGKTVYVIIK